MPLATIWVFVTCMVQNIDRALACIAEHDHATRIHLWHDLGSIYELIGDFEAALGAFERMLRLSWVAASKTKAAVAFNKMGRVWRRKGDLKLALGGLFDPSELIDRPLYGGANLAQVAGHAAGVIHDGFALSYQTVKKRRLTDVREDNDAN